MNDGQATFSHVLITRPQDEAEDLAALLAPMGVEAIIQPAQEFSGRALETAELESLSGSDEPRLLIFTSPRSVDLGLPQLPAEILSSATIAAIGPSTTRALKAAGKRVSVAPERGFTSEDLLAELGQRHATHGGRAFVVCAPGGREVLLDRLGELGWDADPLWVYERRAADVVPQVLEDIARAENLLTVFTSEDAMNSLAQRLPPATWYAICRGEWLVISERLRRLARAFGPADIHLAPGPRNADLVSAIRSLT